MPSQAKRILKMHSVCKYSYHLKLRIFPSGDLCSKSTLSSWSSTSQTTNSEPQCKSASFSYLTRNAPANHLSGQDALTQLKCSCMVSAIQFAWITNRFECCWVSKLLMASDLNNFCQVWSKFSVPSKNPKLNREKLSRKQLGQSEGSLQESGSFLWSDITHQNLATLRGCVLNPSFTRSWNTI